MKAVKSIGSALASVMHCLLIVLIVLLSIIQCVAVGYRVWVYMLCVCVLYCCQITLLGHGGRAKQEGLIAVQHAVIGCRVRRRSIVMHILKACFTSVDTFMWCIVRLLRVSYIWLITRHMLYHVKACGRYAMGETAS